MFQKMVQKESNNPRVQYLGEERLLIVAQWLAAR